MVSILRKHQQTLMIFITIIVIIAFVWLYDPTTRSPGRGPNDAVAQIYDRPVSVADFQRGARKLQICQELGLFELLTSLTTDARNQNQQIANFVFNGLVIRHEAEALGLAPSDDEIVAAIKALPAFQTNASYDSAKYNTFVQRLASFGFTAQQIEESVQDDLRLKKLKQLLGSTITAAPSEVRFAFERRNQKSELSYVTLSSEEIAKTIQVTDDELKKAFEERKDSLKTDELRKVRFVAFTLSEEQKKLEGKDKAAAMQTLVDRAEEFALAMTMPDASFEAVAQKFQVPLAESPEFAQKTPPKELGESPQVAAVAFTKLSLDQPNSDTIVTPNGYYVLQLTGITPARPLAFEEAKPKLLDQLKNERTEELLTLKATEVRTKIDAELKAGKTFAEAATAAGLQAQQMPPFSMIEPGKLDQPGAREMVFGSTQLEPGQLSEPVPFSGGRLIFRVEKRHPVDESVFEKEKPILVENLSRFRRESAFEVWLAERRKLANLQTMDGVES